MAINHQGLLISGDLKGAKATIEALTGVVGGTFALATDTSEIGYHDGTNWHWSDFTGSGFDLEAEVAGASSATPVLADLMIFFLDADGTLRKTTFTDFLTNLAVPELNTLYGSIDNEITNGNSHDHSGGDGAQIDHGGLAGIGDNDHPQYIRHALAGAANDFLIASGAGTFVKATLAQTVTLLDSLMSLIYAPIAKGVTNGDSHNHVGGDGGQISYNDLSNLPTLPISGEYTPTPVGVANVDSTSITGVFFYMRIGAYVLATGLVNVDPTTVGVTTDVRFPLPVASNIGSANDVMGSGNAQGNDDTCSVIGDATNDAAILRYTPIVNTAVAFRITFMYKII